MKYLYKLGIGLVLIIIALYAFESSFMDHTDQSVNEIMLRIILLGFGVWFILGLPVHPDHR